MNVDKSVSTTGSVTLVPGLPASQLSSCYWNIHGHSSKLIGNKLCDPEFLSKIGGSDLVCLSEIHSDREVSIPGYICLKQKIRKKTHRGPKLSGGIGVFIKDKFKNLIQALTNSNEDSIWLKIKKDLCEENEDILVGSYYVSPENKKNSGKVDFFKTLNDEISVFREKGTVLVQGDLNARTGVEQDFVEFDKFDDVLGVDNSSEQSKRNSEDKTINKRGKELLDLCKVNNLLITNGCKVGDLFGKFTSHQWNGSALNDYLLTPDHFMNQIADFSVGDYVPWLSDHCPIYNTIILKNIKVATSVTNNLTEIEPNFIFDSEAKSRFLDELKSETIKHKLSQISDDNDMSALEVGGFLKTILIDTARKCKVKTKKRENEDKSSAPWFDNKCKSAKDELGRLGNLLKKDPANADVRANLLIRKRSFKKVVSYKKRKYKQHITDEMTNSHKNQKQFWKLLDKLSEKKQQHLLLCPITPY